MNLSEPGVDLQRPTILAEPVGRLPGTDQCGTQGGVKMRVPRSLDEGRPEVLDGLAVPLLLSPDAGEVRVGRLRNSGTRIVVSYTNGP